MSTNNAEEKFVILLSKNQRQIYSYILSSVSRKSIADDIMQKTLLLLWRNFSRFKPGTNFAAWGTEIAKYEIFSYRKKKAKEFFLDQKALEAVLEASKKLEKTSDQRMNALEGCLKKLSDKNRSLIHFRYNEGYSCMDIAREMNRPISTIYKTFARLHASLQDCIRRTLIVWDTQS